MNQLISFVYISRFLFMELMLEGVTSFNKIISRFNI